MNTYPLGTVFPVDGQPHLPTMCHHRICRRRGGQRKTILCYELGTHEFVDEQGKPAVIITPDGPMPFRFCAKHIPARTAGKVRRIAELEAPAMKTLNPGAIQAGKTIARKVFAKRGNHSEAHVSEAELAALLAIAFQLGHESRDNQE
jgi:hypothetical protein